MEFCKIDPRGRLGESVSECSSAQFRSLRFWALCSIKFKNHVFNVKIITFVNYDMFFNNSTVKSCPKTFCPKEIFFFLLGSVVPFPSGFCYRQAAILLCPLGTNIILFPPYQQNTYIHLSLPDYLVLHSLLKPTSMYLGLQFGMTEPLQIVRMK
jgi:hypothetical protein